MNDRSRLTLLAPLAGFCVVVAFGVGVIATSAYESDLGGSAALASAEDEPAGEVLEVELGDVFVKPETLTAEPGPLTIEVHNGGQVDHNLSLGELGRTPMLAPGESGTIEIPALEAGEYTYICEVPGHADAGMTGTLSVAEGDAAAPAGHSMGGMSPKQMVKHDAEVTGSFPAETKGIGGLPLEPKVAPDGTKVFDLTAEKIEWETEPGKIVAAYAYNGMVPGPEIRTKLGDRVRIVLHNDLPEPTTMHFHGLTVPAHMDGVPVISQDAIMPGESFTYEFTVRNTGSNMYHSHFNAQEQVPKGLLGAFIVDDPKDLKVAADYTMILNDGPLGYTLNGKGFPATAPLTAEKGDLIRIRYMNEGFMLHPMHLHGMPQRVVAKDGHMLEHPYSADTIVVAPGERIDVLVKASEAGAWAYHCHILNHAESAQGMFGMVTALIVE